MGAKAYALGLAERSVTGEPTGRQIAVFKDHQLFVALSRESADTYRNYLAGAYPKEVYTVLEAELVV